MKRKTTAPALSPLEILQAKSASAVSIIRNTIAQLKDTNAAIETEHSNNVETIAKLNETNSALDTLKSDNLKVIANFEKLLS